MATSGVPSSRSVPLADPCRTIAIDHPVTADDNISTADALDLMVEHDINQLPLLDANGAVSDFLLRRDIAVDSRPELSAVIMAGGFGKRLMPLTEGVPKPMLPVGDRPVLERTIRQLRRSGIRDVSMTTHYLGDRIEDHFGDGEEFGVRINYTNEDQPMGTAGGLKLTRAAGRPVRGDQRRHPHRRVFRQDAGVSPRARGRAHRGGPPLRDRRAVRCRGVRGVPRDGAA